MGRARRGADPELGEKVATAVVRKHGVGPQKVRDVVDLIRGLSVGEAFQRLQSTHRPSSVPMLTRLLKSAASNAEQAGQSDTDELIVGTIFVDGGTMLKRWQPMGQGRAGRIRKRTCHVTVHLYTPAE